MTITVDASGLENLIRGLDRLQKAIPPAIARGLNEGGDKVRTQVQKALQKQTGVIRYASVTSRVRTKRAYAAEGGLESYRIIISPRATKMFEFKTEVKKGPGGGVTAWLWNKPHRFPRSFEGSGKIAGQLKMRKEDPRLPIRSFDGPNMAKEAVKDQAADAFFSTAETAVPTAVAKHLLKAL